MGDGKSSRLYKTLVYDKRIARDVTVAHYTREIAGEFIVQITANPGQSLDEIEEVVQEHLEGIRREPPTEREVGYGPQPVRGRQRAWTGEDRGLRGKSRPAEPVPYVRGRSEPYQHRHRAVPRRHRRGRSARGGAVSRSKQGPYDRFDRRRGRGRVPVRRHRQIDDARQRLASVLQSAGSRAARNWTTASTSCTSRTPRLPAVSMSLIVDTAGATGDPPDRPGLSHLTAVMLPEGTPTMTSQEISEEMEFIGAHLGSSAGYEQVSASTSALTQHRGRAMEILADVVTHASFPEHELERVRKERLVDLRRIADDPNLICAAGLTVHSCTAKGHAVWQPAVRHGRVHRRYHARRDRGTVPTHIRRRCRNAHRRR